MPNSMTDMSGSNKVELVSFSNETKEDQSLLRQFVRFHWTHYRGDPQYIPLLDYEYLGFKLMGIKGFFEPDNLFFKHARARFFLAKSNGEIRGRCMAFVNDHHNQKWNDKVGFIGQFESVDDSQVARSLLDASAAWLKDQGMDTMRGPQNLPVNDATPGLLTEGFDSRPVMYYHYNKPYYPALLEGAGFKSIKKVLSWEVPPANPWEEKLVRVSQKVVKRYNVVIETWDQRPPKVRRREMFEIYNDAWEDNWGFVPFTWEEFDHLVEEMQLIMDKGLFIFLYINGEAAAFFGGVPNVTERMTPFSFSPRFELLRAAKMLLTKHRVTGFRLGYLGVKKKYQRLGLDGVMLWQQKEYSRKKGYAYCDMGWVLEDNTMTVRLTDLMGATLSKTYTIYERAVG